MFFESITLKKDSWHWRLQTWMYGTFFWEDRPTNYCPYFWLIVFSLVISPIFVPTKLLIKLFIFLWKNIVSGSDNAANWLERIVFEPMEKKMISKRVSNMKFDNDFFLGVFQMTAYGDGELMRLTNCSDYYDIFKKSNNYLNNDELRSVSYNKREKLARIFEKWKEENPNWKEILKKELDRREAILFSIKAEREAREEKERQLKYKKDIAKAKRRNLIVKYTSMIGPVILIAAVCIGFYYLGTWMITWNWNKIIEQTLLVLALLISGVVVFLIGKLVFSLLGADLLVDKIYSPLLDKIGNGCGWFYIKVLCSIGRFFKLLFIMFFDWKKENCPGIEWEE